MFFLKTCNSINTTLDFDAHRSDASKQHTCHKLWIEICEMSQIFKGDLIKFCEIFIKNHFGAPPK